MFISNDPKCNNIEILYNPCWEVLVLCVNLLTGRSEHCGGYKAALVHLRQRQCLAQGHSSKEKKELLLLFLIAHSHGGHFALMSWNHGCVIELDTALLT